jgi:membrane protease YdiL (CAAX protease family)
VVFITIRPGGQVEADYRPSDGVSRRDGWTAVAYFAVYLSYLFWHQENEFAHWVTMVFVPVAIAYTSLGSHRRSFKNALETIGLRRGNLRRGVGWAILAGALITAFQVFWGGRAEAIQEVIRSGQAVWLFPLSLVFMMVLAGLTEEVLFRGFLQTRLERLVQSRWVAVVGTAFLFGLYHLPYAYLNPQWPSYGDWGSAWGAAFGNGIPGGLILGGLYVISRGNLLACVLLHSLINAAPAMTMIHFGGG